MGGYTLSMKKGKQGIPAGNYQVLVTGTFFTPKNIVIKDEMDTGTRPMLDPAYAETETTPLSCTVPNDNGYDFIVKPSQFYERQR
jgi:hypothetical protein